MFYYQFGFDDPFGQSIYSQIWSYHASFPLYYLRMKAVESPLPTDPWEIMNKFKKFQPIEFAMLAMEI